MRLGNPLQKAKRVLSMRRILNSERSAATLLSALLMTIAGLVACQRVERAAKLSLPDPPVGETAASVIPPPRQIHADRSRRSGKQG